MFCICIGLLLWSRPSKTRWGKFRFGIRSCRILFELTITLVSCIPRLLIQQHEDSHSMLQILLARSGRQRIVLVKERQSKDSRAMQIWKELYWVQPSSNTSFLAPRFVIASYCALVVPLLLGWSTYYLHLMIQGFAPHQFSWHEISIGIMHHFTSGEKSRQRVITKTLPLSAINLFTYFLFKTKWCHVP